MNGHKIHSPKIDVRMMKREGWIDLIIMSNWLLKIPLFQNRSGVYFGFGKHCNESNRLWSTQLEGMAIR